MCDRAIINLRSEIIKKDLLTLLKDALENARQGEPYTTLLPEEISLSHLLVVLGYNWSYKPGFNLTVI